MAFAKKTWKDRIAEFPTRRRLTKEDNTSELVTVAREEGTLSQEGDAFSAENMNDLENRIDAEFTEVNGNFSGYPDYANAIDIKSYGSSAWKYTCPQNGYILIKRLTIIANAAFQYYINGQSVSIIVAGNSEYKAGGILLPVKKGDVVYGENYSTDYSEMYFISNR